MSRFCWVRWGRGLLIGPLGSLWLKAARDRGPNDPGQTGMDVAFLLLLILTSLTGMLLLALRETSAMGIVLVVHLGMVSHSPCLLVSSCTAFIPSGRSCGTPGKSAYPGPIELGVSEANERQL